MTKIAHQLLAASMAAPEYWGAVGDGVTDDSAAIAACVDYTLAQQINMILGPKAYRMNSAVSRTVGKVKWGIIGTPGITQLYIPTTNTTGGIIVRSTNRGCQGEFSGFAVVRGGLQADAGGVGGVGFAFTQQEGGAGAGTSVRADRVAAVLEQIDTDTKRFDVGLDFSGHFNPLLTACDARGPSKKPGFVDMTYAEAASAVGTSIGIKLTGAYNPTLENCYAEGWADCFLMDSYEGLVTSAASNGAGGTRVTISNGPHPFTTGFAVMGYGGVPAGYTGSLTATRINDTQFDVPVPFAGTFTGKFGLVQGGESFAIRGGHAIESLRGFTFKRLTREPTGWISGVHFNNWERNVIIDGARFVEITANSFYNFDAADGYGSAFIDVLLVNASKSRISLNRFDQVGHSGRKHVVVQDNGTAESGDYIRVVENTFASTADKAVEVASGTIGVVIGPNSSAEGTYSTLYDVPANAVIREDGAVLAGTWVPELLFGGASTGISYSARSGIYRVVGKTMTGTISLTLTSKGSATGLVDITLPDLNTARGDYIPETGNAQITRAANMAGLSVPVGAAVSDTPPRLRLRGLGATGTAALTEANFTDTSDLSISFSVPLT